MVICVLSTIKCTFAVLLHADMTRAKQCLARTCRRPRAFRTSLCLLRTVSRRPTTESRNRRLETTAKPTHLGANSRESCAYFRVRLETSREPDCLADDAVLCEPVSGRNSLISGKNTGNLRYYGANATSQLISPRLRFRAWPSRTFLQHLERSEPRSAATLPTWNGSLPAIGRTSQTSMPRSGFLPRS